MGQVRAMIRQPDRYAFWSDPAFWANTALWSDIAVWRFEAPHTTAEVGLADEDDSDVPPLIAISDTEDGTWMFWPTPTTLNMFEDTAALIIPGPGPSAERDAVLRRICDDLTAEYYLHKPKGMTC